MPLLKGLAMQRFNWISLTLILVGTLCLPLSTAWAVESDVAKGKANLQEAGPFDEDKMQTVELSAGGLTLTAKLRIDDEFDEMMVNANAQVTNNTEADMYFHYFVAFFDEEGNLIASADEGSFGNDGLEPGQSMPIGSCRIRLPRQVIDEIASYQLRLYTDDRPIGQS